MAKVNAFHALLNAVQKELAKVGDEGKSAYEQQLISSNWNTGSLIDEHPECTPGPSTSNSELIKRLSKKCRRPPESFYNSLRFFRAYSKIPENSYLKWSHYKCLMRVEDESQRRKYEKEASSNQMSWRYLHGLILDDKDRARQKMLGESDANKNAVSLKYNKGKLYHYKLIEERSVELVPNTMLVDLGFSMRREVSVNAKAKYHGGHCIEAVKGGGGYRIKAAASQDQKVLYTYKAFKERIVDGDTLIANIDCGFRTWTRQRLRLRGIDVLEKNTTKGEKAKQFVKDKLGKVDFIIIKVYKEGKYGRFLADVFYMPQEADRYAVVNEGRFLNQDLLDEGLAVRW